jgi:DNA-directed RNA polymerase specialized sigma subunit
MMKKLTEQERFVIYHHYMLGKKFVEISRELKLGASWISRIHSSAIKKMRVAHPCYNNAASVQAS